MIDEFCIFRTRSAGVHCGTLVEMNNLAALVKDARRIWQWRGAFTLNELANHGGAESSRISEPVPRILLTEVIEVIPCTMESRKNLENSRWDKA